MNKYILTTEILAEGDRIEDISEIQDLFNEVLIAKGYNLTNDNLELIINAEYRVCSECGKDFTRGYVIEGGLNYYCSDECLSKNITPEEYETLFDEGNGETYWTEFE